MAIYRGDSLFWGLNKTLDQLDEDYKLPLTPLASFSCDVQLDYSTLLERFGGDEDYLPLRDYSIQELISNVLLEGTILVNCPIVNNKPSVYNFRRLGKIEETALFLFGYMAEQIDLTSEELRYFLREGNERKFDRDFKKRFLPTQDEIQRYLKSRGINQFGKNIHPVYNISEGRKRGSMIIYLSEKEEILKLGDFKGIDWETMDTSLTAERLAFMVEDQPMLRIDHKNSLFMDGLNIHSTRLAFKELGGELWQFREINRLAMVQNQELIGIINAIYESGMRRLDDYQGISRPLSLKLE